MLERRPCTWRTHDGICRTSTIIWRLAGAFGLAAFGAAAIPSSDIRAQQTRGHAAGTYPLVTLQTGQDPSCRGGNQHKWPVGMGAEQCHGWRAVDATGRQHDNSAKRIECHPDGSFSFTQHAGNLTCEGPGLTKTYPPDTPVMPKS